MRFREKLQSRMSTDETSVRGNAFSTAIAPFQGASDCSRFRRAALAALACPTLSNRRPVGARKLRSSAENRASRERRQECLRPQKPQRGKIVQRRVSTLRKMRKHTARCKCAIAETREKSPENFACLGAETSASPSRERTDAARRNFVRGKSRVAGTKAGMPSPQEKLPLPSFAFAVFLRVLCVSRQKSVPAKRVAGPLFFKLQALNFKLFSPYFFGIAGRDAAAIAWP